MFAGEQRKLRLGDIENTPFAPQEESMLSRTGYNAAP